MDLNNAEFEVGDKHIIFNGAAPLPGCPDNWDEAHKWQDEANVNKDKDEEPTWSFDCGYKLDFDGSLITISSRFYPPAKYYGATWDGSVTIYFAGKEIEKKGFDCKTIDELKEQVEKYVSDFRNEFNEFLGMRAQKSS